MDIEILKVRGYTIRYSASRKLFCLVDEDGEEVAQAKTQAELEEHIKKLDKKAFKVPVAAFQRWGSFSMRQGRVTSVSPEERTARFAYDDKSRFSHTKVMLRNSHVYEKTDENERIHQEVGDRLVHIKELEAQVAVLLDGLEKPINLAYFGLE